ncbi:hypothetical protein GUJ93_ZPchr0012g22234 [Zizania palustris]|uniref:Uncharacterized protein n=1 Tax=Zizania palustris TaxID=103762 RepID=A0A8J5WQ22_ZIZPA|nr:hypothetical protein GUJ93_ZPchr0012g22234 [Zizania palustris]
MRPTLFSMAPQGPRSRRPPPPAMAASRASVGAPIGRRLPPWPCRGPSSLLPLVAAMSVPMALLLSLLLAMAFLAASAAAATSASWSTRPEDDLLNGLPGQSDVGFRHYADYVGVGSGSGKTLFY